MVRTPINFDLIRWPIDIVVFVLAFGHNVWAGGGLDHGYVELLRHHSS
jgi:hypothetical protein